jgi:TPR repeat protein
MIGGSTRRSNLSSLGTWTMVILFPSVLLIVGFSSCDLRNRSAKHACNTGDVQQCLDVAKYYQDKGADKGLISFAMSDDDTALTYYFRACKLRSPAGCAGMTHMDLAGQSARNTTGRPDIVDALIDVCAAGVDSVCKNLESSYWVEGDDWIANRSAIAFKKRCAGGDANACHLAGSMARKNQGGLHEDTAR